MDDIPTSRPLIENNRGRSLKSSDALAGRIRRAEGDYRRDCLRRRHLEADLRKSSLSKNQ
jgi:hypothetical protein